MSVRSDQAAGQKQPQAADHQHDDVEVSPSRSAGQQPEDKPDHCDREGDPVDQRQQGDGQDADQRDEERDSTGDERKNVQHDGNMAP